MPVEIIIFLIYSTSLYRPLMLFSAILTCPVVCWNFASNSACSNLESLECYTRIIVSSSFRLWFSDPLLNLIPQLAVFMVLGSTELLHIRLHSSLPIQQQLFMMFRLLTELKCFISQLLNCSPCRLVRGGRLMPMKYRRIDVKCTGWGFLSWSQPILCILNDKGDPFDPFMD